MTNQSGKMKRIAAVGLMSFFSVALNGQATQGSWSLRQCIDYARSNNIQVQTTQIAQESAAEDLAQAKAQRLPSLSFSTSQNLVNQKQQQEDGSYEANGTYSGNYALNAGVTLYNGGKLTNSLKQQEVVGKSAQYQVYMAMNDIEIAVTQAYLNILYANENVKINRQNVESSAAQLERSKALLEAGSIAPSDYAQMESQYSSDKYQLTVSETTLSQDILTLKQLLELGLNEHFEVEFPDLDSTDVLVEIPALADVYARALEVMPEVENSRLNIESSQLGEKIAASEALPSITASAAVGTGNISGTNYSFYNQLNNQLNENIGVTLSVPIFNRRQAKTSIAKARLQTRQAELDYTNMEKELLRTIESLYQDAVSAQSRYVAANDQVKSAEISYNLVLEQFNAGMKNTVDLLTQKNEYLASQQEQIQAKYQAVLSIKLLNFYQNEPITL